jgi:predicted metallopeptidase
MASTQHIQNEQPPFDYTSALTRVCADVCFRVPALNHIDMERVAVCYSQTRHSDPVGIFACVTPLRFKDGDLTKPTRCGEVTLHRYFGDSGIEYLYIIHFYIPRFIELRLPQKLETIVHELYHISPLFNGDLRRFAGRCSTHGSSQKKYDQIVQGFVDHWLKQNPPPQIWDFLRFSYKELISTYGKLVGKKINFPKIIPVKK